MEMKIYITEEERTKCQKVADAFAELYEMADIVVVDVGRYGFVMLKYYTPPHGFEEACCSCKHPFLNILTGSSPLSSSPAISYCYFPCTTVVLSIRISLKSHSIPHTLTFTNFSSL